MEKSYVTDVLTHKFVFVGANAVLRVKGCRMGETGLTLTEDEYEDSAISRVQESINLSCCLQGFNEGLIKLSKIESSTTK